MMFLTILFFMIFAGVVSGGFQIPAAVWREYTPKILRNVVLPMVIAGVLFFLLWVLM